MKLNVILTIDQIYSEACKLKKKDFKNLFADLMDHATTSFEENTEIIIEMMKHIPPDEYNTIMKFINERLDNL